MNITETSKFFYKFAKSLDKILLELNNEFGTKISEKQFKALSAEIIDSIEKFGPFRYRLKDDNFLLQWEDLEKIVLSIFTQESRLAPIDIVNKVYNSHNWFKPELIYEVIKSLTLKNKIKKEFNFYALPTRKRLDLLDEFRPNGQTSKDIE